MTQPLVRLPLTKVVFIIKILSLLFQPLVGTSPTQVGFSIKIPNPPGGQSLSEVAIPIQDKLSNFTQPPPRLTLAEVVSFFMVIFADPFAQVRATIANCQQGRRNLCATKPTAMSTGLAPISRSQRTISPYTKVPVSE